VSHAELEQWLSVATRGLCESAAARVRADIGEHYLSALEAGATTGVDPLTVEQCAVAALGDAEIANREYRRVLLTDGESHLLSGLRSLSTHQWVGILLVAATALYAISVGTSQFNYLFATLAIAGMLRAIPIASTRAGWMVRFVRWGVLTAFYTMWFVSWPSDGILPVVGFCLFALAHAHLEYKLFVLRRKVPVEQRPRRLWV
jgi:hypothetical protein